MADDVGTTADEVRADEARPRSRRPSRFALALALITLAALGLRVGYVLGAKRHDDTLPGDQFYYSTQADTLARGEGFRHPAIFDRVVPAADHPPLTSIVVAPASWVTSTPHRRILAQRLIMALVGAAAVAAIGVAARAVAGTRRGATVGLVAAGLAALHPGLWINDGLVMSESLGALTIALVILASYRTVERPGPARLALLGGAVALAALARAEALLLVPLVVVPVAFTRRQAGAEADQVERATVGWRTRLTRLAVAAAAIAVVLAPWVGPNLVRFDRPTTLSTNDGLTLLGTNCDAAWHGPGTGLWVLQCIGAVDTDGDGVDDYTEFVRGTPSISPHQDFSDQSALYRAAAFRYLRGHLSDLPRVVLVREARLFGLYDVDEMIYYNTGEGRETWASWAAIVGWWVLLPLAVAGSVILGRRRRPVWLLAAHLVAAAVVGGVFYGLWRFRIGAEVAVVIAAAVAVVAAADALAARRGSPPRPPSTDRLAP